MEIGYGKRLNGLNGKMIGIWVAEGGGLSDIVSRKNKKRASVTYQD